MTKIEYYKCKYKDGSKVSALRDSLVLGDYFFVKEYNEGETGVTPLLIFSKTSLDFVLPLFVTFTHLLDNSINIRSWVGHSYRNSHFQEVQYPIIESYSSLDEVMEVIDAQLMIEELKK